MKIAELDQPNPMITGAAYNAPHIKNNDMVSASVRFMCGEIRRDNRPRFLGVNMNLEKSFIILFCFRDSAAFQPVFE